VSVIGQAGLGRSDGETHDEGHGGSADSTGGYLLPKEARHVVAFSGRVVVLVIYKPLIAYKHITASGEAIWRPLDRVFPRK